MRHDVNVHGFLIDTYSETSVTKLDLWLFYNSLVSSVCLTFIALWINLDQSHIAFGASPGNTDVGVVLQSLHAVSGLCKQ